MSVLKVLPLNSIRAFEAAARHASFKRAAEELNVTHGAISRQVSLLEAWLGTMLFRRLNRQVVLTQAGSTLFGEVSPALQRIALATASLTRQSRETVLVLNAPPTFVMRWLIPRLSNFLRTHKYFEVKLETSLKPVDFANGGYDIAIRRAPEVPPGVQSRIFLPEMLTPVCTPELAAAAKLNKPADLKSQTLIHTATAPLAWPQWLASADVSDRRAGSSLNFEEMFFTLQAALNGLGVAIAPAALVLDDVNAGRLSFPFALHNSRDHDYRLLYTNSPEKKAAIEEFSAWITEEGRKSIMDIDELFSKPGKAAQKTTKRAARRR